MIRVQTGMRTWHFTLRTTGVVVQFGCHPEQAFLAQRGIWASREMRRVLGEAGIAGWDRFLFKVTTTLQGTVSARLLFA